MARMIPDINPLYIENDGERRFYQAAQELPDEFTVCHSFLYRQCEGRDEPELLREVDFVIVHPQMGYVVVEVKQGIILFQNGSWYEFKNNEYCLLSKDPVEQARNGMFAILGEYKKHSGNSFPLKIRFAFGFPESTRLEGILPSEIDPNCIFLFNDIEDPLQMERKIQLLFKPITTANKEAVDFLIKNVLAPSFRVFSRPEDEIEQFKTSMQRILTDEQERILYETELDNRKIFLGAAGSGKTFIAMEKSRRLASEGKRVLMTCFNKNLASYLRAELPDLIYVSNIHDYFLQAARISCPELDIPLDIEERQEFFTYKLPSLAFDHLVYLPEEDKFDAIIIDEGQDLKIEWFDCMEAALKESGGLFIFADPAQSIFYHDIEAIKNMPVSKQQLTRNLRNTGNINDWMSQYLPGRPMMRTGYLGVPIKYIPFSSADEQRLLIEKEIGRLVSQGVQLKRIQILSPHVKVKSCLAGRDKLKEWPIIESNDTNKHGIRFSTIRSFKGLEADIVFLIDVSVGSKACTDADIYVGGSRARYQLYIFHDINMLIKKGSN